MPLNATCMELWKAFRNIFNASDLLFLGVLVNASCKECDFVTFSYVMFYILPVHFHIMTIKERYPDICLISN